MAETSRPKRKGDFRSVDGASASQAARMTGSQLAPAFSSFRKVRKALRFNRLKAHKKLKRRSRAAPLVSRNPPSLALRSLARSALQTRGFPNFFASSEKMVPSERLELSCFRARP